MERKPTRIRKGQSTAPAAANTAFSKGKDRADSDGFTFSFTNGCGLLTIENIPLGRLALVERLELAISDPVFPFDVTGGVRGLRHRRHILSLLTITVSRNSLEELVARNLSGSAFCGSFAIAFEDKHISVLLDYGPEGSRAKLSFRVLMRPSENSLDLVIDEPRIIGPLPVCPLTAAASALFEMAGVRPLRPELKIKNPVKSALTEILPFRGWRLPNCGNTTLRNIEILPDKAVFEFCNFNLIQDIKTDFKDTDEEEIELLRRFERLSFTQKGDVLLCCGLNKEARLKYLELLDRIEDSAEATARLAMVDICNPVLLKTGYAQADLAFKLHPDRMDLAAVAAQGAALLGDKRAEEEALLAIADKGNALERFAAYSRLGEILLESDPKAAVNAYLKALSFRLEDPKTLQTLLKIFASLGDREQVLSLIPRRIEAQNKAKERIRAYVEVGQILLKDMNDPAGAFRYFEQAYIQDPFDLDASSGLAEACIGLGYIKRALIQLDHVARVSKELGDVRGAAKAIAAIGEIWMKRGDVEIATHRFREALDLAPDLHLEKEKPLYPCILLISKKHCKDDLCFDLSELGAIAIEERDETTITSSIAGEEQLIAGFKQSIDRDLAIESLRTKYSDEIEIQAIDVRDEKWRDGWRDYFEPVILSEIAILTPWMESVYPDHIEIVIDPGRAFGTGGHATTKNILVLLEDLARKPSLFPKRILDVGTGSGVLAIAAAKLGAAAVTAIDIDSDAVSAAAKNVQVNGVQEIVNVQKAHPKELSGLWPLVIANLELSIFNECAPDIAKLVKPLGIILASGLLTEQVGDFMKLFLDYRITAQNDDNGWTALLIEHRQ